MEDDKKDKAEEPIVSYKTITVSTLQEQKDLQRKYWASLSPEERFADFYQLMHRFYSFRQAHIAGSKIIIGA